jgi:hypothetical protein
MEEGLVCGCSCSYRWRAASRGPARESRSVRNRTGFQFNLLKLPRVIHGIIFMSQPARPSRRWVVVFLDKYMYQCSV